jgi:hypothetical protein
MRKLSVIALLGAVVVGGAVLAQEGHHHGGFMRHHINSRINAALDAAKVNAEQRASIEKSRDKVFAAFDQILSSFLSGRFRTRRNQNPSQTRTTQLNAMSAAARAIDSFAGKQKASGIMRSRAVARFGPS